MQISDLIQKSLTIKNKNLDLNNGINSNAALSPAQKNLVAKSNNTQVSENNVTTREFFHALDVTADLPETESNVTAVVAKVKHCNQRSNLQEEQAPWQALHK